MWTTSNSRAKPLRLPTAVALLALAACPGPAPDTPRPARDPAIFAHPAGPAATPMTQEPVELRSARVLAVRGDSLLERLAGAMLLRTARSPLAIEVITAEPLGDVARNASAEIYLNGERLADTWPLPPDRLVLVLPDAQRLRPPLEVTVAWLGNESRTRSRRPLVLTEEQLRPFR
jgi:hypothetical protein